MSDMLVKSESLSAVADAIRIKGGTSDAMTFPDGFVNAVGAIKAGQTVIPYRESDAGNPIRMCAHRGYHAYAVENTADAVLAALNMGYGFVECDLYESADGVWYVNHNDSIVDTDGVTHKLTSTTSDVLDAVVIGGIDDKINRPLKLTRFSEVLEAAALIDRDFEIWTEMKDADVEQIDRFVAYLQQNGGSVTDKIRIFGSLGLGGTYIVSGTPWKKILYFTCTTEQKYDECVALKNNGVDVIPYAKYDSFDWSLADRYYAEYGLETAIHTTHYSMFGAITQYPGIKYACGDNQPNWNWPEFFEYKDKSEFDTEETWAFTESATSDLGNSFTTSGTVTFGETGMTLGTASSYAWLNLPYSNKRDGVAEFEFDWTPNDKNQRVSHIGGYNIGNGVRCHYNTSVAFYGAGAWFDMPRETAPVNGVMETHTVRICWNEYAYTAYVDGRAIGSDLIAFNTATTSAGRNFCFGSGGTGFTGTIRNLKMWY